MTAWAQQVSGTANKLRAVWGLSKTDVYAAGDAGTIIHYNGTSWSPEALPAAVVGETFTAIWGRATDGGPEVFAFSSTGRVVHKVGGTWHDVGFVMANGNAVLGAWLSGPTNLWAAQPVGKYEQSVDDGASWAVVFTDLNAAAGPIRGFDASNIYSVNGTSEILFYNGIAWTSIPASAAFVDVWPDSATTGYVVRAGGIARFTGTGLVTIAQTIPDGDLTLASIFGASPTVVYAVGRRTSTGKVRVLSFESGSTWLDDTVPDLVATLNQAWVAADGSGWAVGNAGVIIAKVILPLELTGATPATTNGIRVTLSTEPADVSPTAPGDALNPATWTVTRLDNGFEFTVTDVHQVDETTFIVNVLESLGSVFVQHEVQANGLLSRAGVPIAGASSFDFTGLLAAAKATTQAVQASRRFVPTDVANPPVPQPGTPGGTLIMTAGGDYQSVSGAELLKKLINRRLSTMQGGFFHLPAYGLGIDPKQRIPTSDLIRLQAMVRKQIQLEPDVQEARVGVSQDQDNGILYITWKVTQRTTGQSIDGSTQFGGTAAGA